MAADQPQGPGWWLASDRRLALDGDLDRVFFGPKPRWPVTSPPSTPRF